MAKAKTGGTSAKLRGVVGDFIYQVVKNPQGFTEQRVITYTREKYNANTRYQALARMQITIFMNCMNLLTPIICDSFEGLRSRVNSCNRFVQINMPLIQDYCVQHWFESLACQWPNKGNHNATFFPFWISEGSYKVPQLFSWTIITDGGNWPLLRFNLAGTFARKIDLRKALGFNNGDSLNVLYWLNNGGTLILYQVQLSSRFNDNTVITSANVYNLFEVKQIVLGYAGRYTISFLKDVQFNKNSKLLTLRLLPLYKSEYAQFTVNPDFFATIFSKRKGNLWQRNTTRFYVNSPSGDQTDFGDPPFEAYHDWDANYNDESYQDYFVR
jgi:hypothetical protein